MTFTFFYESTSPLSNWYKTTFIHKGITYNCGEQYMMHQKALLFYDKEVAELIMEQSEPRKQKMLGRDVREYDDEIWMENCQDLMVDGLFSKFTQNGYCLTTLLATGDSVLVETSPTDKIWGIGLKKDDPRINNPSKWLGDNLLGKVLMMTRNKIRQL